MSCNQIQILPVESEIFQLKKELAVAHSEATYYKHLHQSNLAMQEHLQFEHETKIFQMQKELIHVRTEANYYKNLHQRNVAMRERLEFEYDSEVLRLKKIQEEHLHEIVELKAKVKLRERQLFGRKSEKNNPKNDSPGKPKSRGQRGQRAGKKPPKKRDYSHLPVRPEVLEIPENECLCPSCKAPYADMGTSEDSDLIEVQVKAYVRRIKRKKYKKTCDCVHQPIILTASTISKILSKSHLGNSVWVHLLLQKFWHGMPLHRAIRALTSHKLAIPAGTVSWGFMRLLNLFRLVYQKIVERSLQDKHWFADETGWKVFEALEGKANYRWFLWVFRSSSTSVFVLDPSRSARVVEQYFGNNSQGIISCDRYRAYFCFTSKTNGRFLVAFCWVHVRRDFLALVKDWPVHQSWGMDWMEEIRHLYHLNDLRLGHQNNIKFLEYQKKLEEGLEAFKKKISKQLEEVALVEPCKKILESLNRHWHGLTTFLKYPEVPMDNNTAERELRGGAVGRKNYYGSGSIESAEFTAIMFTIIQTLLLWKINPQTWLNKFFDYIGGNWEKNFDQYLPWNMSLEEMEKLALRKGYDPPD